MDDITFCLSECKQTDCFRHPSNIQDRTIPHSYADFTGTETCPEFAKDINVPINDDTISRKAALDVLNKLADIKYTHMPYYGYYLGALHDAADDIKGLPSVQPESSEYEELDFVKEHERIPVTLTVQPPQVTGKLDESCTDCPLYDNDTHNCPRFNKVIPRVLEEQQVAGKLNSEWLNGFIFGAYMRGTE